MTVIPDIGHRINIKVLGNRSHVQWWLAAEDRQTILRAGHKTQGPPTRSRRTTAAARGWNPSAVNNFQLAPGTHIADNLFGGQFSRRTAHQEKYKLLSLPQHLLFALLQTLFSVGPSAITIWKYYYHYYYYNWKKKKIYMNNDHGRVCDLGNSPNNWTIYSRESRICRLGYDGWGDVDL